MRSNKNFLIAALLVVIVAMSVGYAALAQQLTINGTSKVSASWDVSITGITAKSLTGASVANGYPTFTSTDATFDVSLDYPGASASFDIVVANNGTIDATLDNISGLIEANSDEPVYLTYAVTGISEGERLDAGETTTATVTVTWSADETAVPETAVTKTATIHLNYVQAD